MALVDANIVLRYILKDNKELARNAKVIIEKKEVEIPFEVIAEIVYVLEKVSNWMLQSHCDNCGSGVAIS